jgi:hypothetical protein
MTCGPPETNFGEGVKTSPEPVFKEGVPAPGAWLLLCHGFPFGGTKAGHRHGVTMSSPTTHHPLHVPWPSV